MPKVARVKSAALTFHGPLGGPFRALLRSLAAMSSRIPVRTGIKSTQNRSVAYRVVKLEMSKFSALERSPGAKSQNHRDDFLKTVPTRNLTGNTRHMSSGHEVRRYTPSATASTCTQPHNLGLSRSFFTPFFCHPSSNVRTPCGGLVDLRCPRGPGQLALHGRQGRWACISGRYIYGQQP